MRQWIIAVAVAATAALPAGAQGVDATLDRATAAWAKVRTSAGTFEQTVTNSLVGRSGTQRARFEQQKPNLLSVWFDGSPGGRIVADGTHLWAYLPASTPGQVLRMPVSAGGPLPSDLTGRFLDNPRRRYTIAAGSSATIGGRPTDALVLTPRAGQELGFDRATVWIDRQDGLIRQFETIEGPITRRVRFTELTVGAKVDPKSFRYTAPKGVRIVERD